jgi:hypothetical protein
MARQGRYSDPSFPTETEQFVATLAEVSASEGDATAVAILAVSEAEIEHQHHYSDYGGGADYWRLKLRVDPGLYGRLGEDGRREVLERLSTLAGDVSRGLHDTDVCPTVVLAPLARSADGWRPRAKAWLSGEGINNQGRVRSDNIAPYQHDGLLFRSKPEVHLYTALKARGIYMAPLPVFLRGGERYERLEPDFLLVHDGVVMVVEVDGGTVHRETPAEAHARTQGLQREGVHIERLPADECETPDLARSAAEKLVRALEKYAGRRG